MDKSLKKKLLLIFDYLNLNGCHYAEKEGDFHSMNFHDQNNQWSCVSQSNQSRGNIRLPLDIVQELEVFIDNAQIEFDSFGEDSYGFEVRLYPETKTISVYEQYSEYLTEDTKTVTIDTEGEPEVKEIVDYYCKKEEICRGNITFDFYGGGDSGYIEENGMSDFDGKTEIYEPAEDMFLRLLNIEFGGWEINEGSYGECIIDMDLEQMELNYNQNYEVAKSDEVWSMSLDTKMNENTEDEVETEEEDIILSSVKKLLDLLFFNGLDVSYSVQRIPHSVKDYISIDIEVDVSRFISSSDKYDDKYAQALYDLENTFETISKYLGLKGRQIYGGVSYINWDFLDNEAHNATRDLHKILRNHNELSPEEIDNSYINVYYREDDFPFINVEAGANDIPDDYPFEEIVWDIVKEYKHLNELTHGDDITFWVNM